MNIRTLTNGIEQNYRCKLYNKNQIVISDTFEEHGQAWVYGQNWKMMHKDYTYEIERLKDE